MINLFINISHCKSKLEEGKVIKGKFEEVTFNIFKNYFNENEEFSNVDNVKKNYLSDRSEFNVWRILNGAKTLVGSEIGKEEMK